MGLSLLHQTVNPVGASFTPNIGLYGWFTLYWNCENADLVINAPTNGSDGQDFIIDVIRTGNPLQDTPHAIGWVSSASKYWSAIIVNQDPTTQAGPWTGVDGGLVHAARHRFYILNDAVCLYAYNPIVAY
jgi:hypothetical protein